MARLISLLIALLSLGQTTLDAYVAQTNLGGNLFLVNRIYALDSEYAPEDLVHPAVLSANARITMRAEAAHALEEMFAAAEKERGYRLMAVSGYRSYQTQATIYKRKLSAVKKEQEAQLYVALPGTSEHQLGLAMDLGRKSKQNLRESFGSTDEGKWVAENAHRFGFIVRYQKEWTDITGYAYEPWHVRYVGKEHAQRIFEQHIPLETYVEQLQQAAFGNYLPKGEGQ